MAKIHKILILTIIGILVLGLAAISYTPNSSSEQDYVQIDFKVSPSDIYTKDCQRNRSTATLEINAADISALDVALLVDFSGKAYDKVGGKIDLIQDFVDQIFENLPAQVGLIPLGSKESLAIPLTSNYELVMEKIGELTPSEGVPSLGEAMEKAIMMLGEGRADAIKVMAIITSHGDFKDIQIPTLNAVDEDITCFTVGVGDFSPPSLRWIAQKTGGAFYSGLSWENLEKVYKGEDEDKVGIVDKLTGVVARELIARVIFSDHAFVEDKPDNCQVGSSDSQITCELEKLEKGEEKAIKFKVGSRKKEPIDAKVELEYTDLEGEIQKVIQDHPGVLEVSNHSPVCVFDWVRLTEAGGENVITGEEIKFKDNSSDCDGSVVKRAWDFDDGTTSTEKNPTHQFNQAGSYAVCLEVTDREKASDEACKTIRIWDPLTASRSISYFIPPELRISERPGSLLVSDEYNQAYEVTLEIEVKGEIWGVILEDGIVEGLSPEDYEIRIPDEYSDDCFPSDNGGLKCRFRKLESDKSIKYGLKFEPDIVSGIYGITGKLSSLEPFFTKEPVTGDQQIEILNCLSVIRAVYCWDIEAEKVSPELCKKDQGLTKDQLDQANIWWFEGMSVPGTCDKSIDDGLMRHILHCRKQDLKANACIDQWREKKEEKEEEAFPAQTSCINQATSADLEEIEGIGSVTAANILEVLPIEGWKDLLEVKGVGEKTIDSIKEQFDLC